MIRERLQPPLVLPEAGVAEAELAARRWPQQLANLGVVPLTSLTTGAALLLVALGYNAARDGRPGASLLFWAGLLGLSLPLGVALRRSASARGERIWAVVLLGLGTYGLKVLYSPTLFDFPDELQHWRTLGDLMQSGHLFTFNPILQVSPLYPGLEVVTDALVSLTGLPSFAAALLVVGAARLLVLLALFLFYEALAGSARTAGAATLLYAANPNFIYFDGQFGYESLALGLAALVLYLLVRQRSVTGWASLGWLAVSLLGILAVVITHHFTQFVLLGVLAGWSLAAFGLGILRRSASLRLEGLRVGVAAITCAVAAGAWLLVVAGPVVDYLGPNFGLGFVELAHVLTGKGGGRVPFHDGAGSVAAPAEQIVGYGSVLLILVALPLGLRAVWRRYRHEPAVLPLVVLAVGYPLTLPLRLTSGGVATAGRLPEFLYLGLAFVVATAMVAHRPWRAPRLVWRPALQAATLVLLLGSVFVGWGPPGRLPSGYLVSADARSVEPEGVAAAEWSRQALGTHRTMAADRTNTLLMGGLGQQQIVSVSNAREDVSPVFFAPSLGPHERFILTATGVQFAVIDFRLSQTLPVSGVYYEFQEPDAFVHRTPMDPAALGKFEGVPDVSRIFDSGDIVIYDLTQVIHAP